MVGLGRLGMCQSGRECRANSGSENKFLHGGGSFFRCGEKWIRAYLIRAQRLGSIQENFIVEGGHFGSCCQLARVALARTATVSIARSEALVLMQDGAA